MNESDVHGWSSAKWGMNKSEILASFSIDTRFSSESTPFGDPVTKVSPLSIPDIEIANHHFQAYFFFEPGRGGLEAVLLKSIEQDQLSCFQPLLRALTTKYGGSKLETINQFRTDVIWKFRSSTITLTRMDMLDTLGMGFVSASYDRNVDTVKKFDV